MVSDAAQEKKVRAIRQELNRIEREARLKYGNKVKKYFNHG